MTAHPSAPATGSSSPPSSLGRGEELLSRRLTHLTVHRKANWLTLTGLALLVVLVAAFGSSAIVLFGVLGAFLSRISIFVRNRANSDLQFRWTTVMLSPVVGALAAIAGVVLVEALRAWDVLGESFADVELRSTSAVTLAIAFLLGFSERLLDSLVTTASRQIAPDESTPNTGGSIAPVDPAGSTGDGPSSDGTPEIADADSSTNAGDARDARDASAEPNG